MALKPFTIKELSVSNGVITANSSGLFGNSFSGTANNATNLGGSAASAYQTTAGLAANVVTLTANNSTNLGGSAASAYQTVAALAASVAALTANNATNLGGVAASGYQTISGLSTAVAGLTANNATNLGGVSAGSYATTSAVAGTYAPLANPALTGTPTAPTAANGTSTGQLATTAFVANTVAGIPTGMVKLTSGTVSAAATLDLNMSSYTGYRKIIILLSNIKPVTSSRFDMLCSTNAGSTFLTASNYNQFGRQLDAPGYNGGLVAYDWLLVGGDQPVWYMSFPSSGFEVYSAGPGYNAEIEWLNPLGASQVPMLRVNCNWITPSGGVDWMSLDNQNYNVAQTTNAFRFKFTTGNIASGNYAIYGVL